MKKSLILTAFVLVVALMATSAFAQVVCPDYCVGYRGRVTMCLVPGLDTAVKNAKVDLSVAPLGVVKTVFTGYDGKYYVKWCGNNCPPQPFFSFTQAWSVYIDGTTSGYGVFSCTDSTSRVFFCCCPTCWQKVIQCFDCIYNLCCTDPSNNCPPAS